MVDPANITCADLGKIVQPFVKRHLSTFAVLAIGLGVFYSVGNYFGGLALIMIAIGSIAPAYVWSSHRNPGLPIVALMGVQSLIIYGMPLITQNQSTTRFSAAQINGAGVEILIFGLAMAMGWSYVANHSPPKPPREFREFTVLQGGSITKLLRLGLLIFSLGALFQIANITGLLGFLPSGVYPIVRTVTDAMSLGGGMISAFMISRGISRGLNVIIFWILYTANSLLLIANYTLFPATGMMMAVSLGLFLGRGKVPFTFLAIVVSCLALLNLSKFEMRDRFWTAGTGYADQSLDQLPERYLEWVNRSMAQLGATPDDSLEASEEDSQKLSDRVNSLVILLQAKRAIDSGRVEPLNGATYRIIPPLFIPRIFWSEKPRTHEGMVILNVHFGHQTREESLVTYISWGLLPEGFANFGSFFGALVVGGLLGWSLGWVEMWSRYFPMTSLQNLIVLTFMINCASSFESVASLWLTSVFQMILGLVGGLWIFTRPKRIDYSRL
jgi:uncharacterized membrane protein